MADVAGAIAAFPYRSAKPDRYNMEGTFNIGGSGAVASSEVDDPGLSLTRSTTGTYSLTFPKCPKVRIWVSLKSATPTVSQAVLTAFDAAAGTATIVTRNGGGTNTDPASGDAIFVHVSAEAR